MLCLMPAPAHSQQFLEPSEEMISAAGDFITSLNEMQRDSALFDFDNDERSNWFFTPVDRRGVPYKVMDEEQRAAARLLLRVFLSAGQKSQAILDAAQQDKLMELVREVAMVQAPGLARARLESIEQAGGEGIRFLWIGGRERGDAHHYRIQGPTFLIEYDNTQNNANHIHLPRKI